MSRVEIERYFSKYVFEFMFSDISREIALAREGRGGGNFLAALGLLCYTEALGRLQNHVRGRSIKDSGRNFETFFDELGSVGGMMPYKAWRCGWESAAKRRVYDVLRCGMAHEYLPKVSAVAQMGAETAMGVYETGDALAINVDAYYRDFRSAASRLFAEYMTTEDASLPEAEFHAPNPC